MRSISSSDESAEDEDGHDNDDDNPSPSPLVRFISTLRRLRSDDVDAADGVGDKCVSLSFSNAGNDIDDSSAE